MRSRLDAKRHRAGTQRKWITKWVQRHATPDTLKFAWHKIYFSCYNPFVQRCLWTIASFFRNGDKFSYQNIIQAQQYLFPAGSGGLDATPGISGITDCPSGELNIPAFASMMAGESRPGDGIIIWEPWVEDLALLVLLRWWVKTNLSVPLDLGSWNRKVKNHSRTHHSLWNPFLGSKYYDQQFALLQSLLCFFFLRTSEPHLMCELTIIYYSLKLRWTVADTLFYHYWPILKKF